LTSKGGEFGFGVETFSGQIHTYNFKNGNFISDGETWKYS